MNRWIKLFLGIITIWAFMFLLPKLYLKIHVVKAVYDNIENEGLHPDALFYSEEETTIYSERALKNQLKSK